MGPPSCGLADRTENIAFHQLRWRAIMIRLPHLTQSTVRLIDRKVLSSIYPVMNSSFYSSVMAVLDKGQPLVYTFIPSFIPNMILLKGFHIHVSL